jgi:thiamine biosynthesis lipoprotein
MIDLQALPHSMPDAAPVQEQAVDSAIEGGSYVFRDEAILGTRMQINLVAQNYSDALAAAQNARLEIDRLNKILNSRDPASELYKLNRSRTHRASPELFEVVAAAERWRAETPGAFSGRLGTVIDLWRNARDRTPSRSELVRMARAADGAYVELDSSTRTITRPDEVQFQFDALAKGWIVDRAFDIARTSPGVSGALVEIGGDLRCGGRAPDSRGWCVGIPDASLPAENAPLLASTHLSNHAIATSGRGPRDRLIDGVYYSPTLSPQDGWPVHHSISVTAVASSAADADAIATTLLTLPKAQAVAWADRHGVTARIQTKEAVLVTPSIQVEQSTASPVRFSQVNASQAKAKSAVAASWPKDWVAHVNFTAPPKQLVRDHNFRSPYMAMWITDLDNKRIRTLFLVGREPDWQKDNYIWWSIYNDTAEKMVATRSMSTSGSGLYKVLWDGTDDQYQPVPGGTYILHVETSRERGKHSHRSLTLNFSQPKAFTDELPTTEEAGSVQIYFHHP